MTDAIKHQAKDEHETGHGARYAMELGIVELLIEDWPDAPKSGAQQMLEQYRPPYEATPTKLFWYRVGP